VELGELCAGADKLLVHHENDEALFSMHNDYEFRLQLSTRKGDCSLSLGL
jgi:hypothetical protein